MEYSAGKGFPETLETPLEPPMGRVWNFLPKNLGTRDIHNVACSATQS